MSEPAEGQIDFEETMAELERIVRALDRPEVPLDEAIELFERGMARLKEAHGWLDRAAGRVEELIADASGSLESRPLAEADLQEAAQGEGSGEPGATRGGPGGSGRTGKADRSGGAD